MRAYERPVIIINDDLAEGVYTASGDWTGSTGGTTTTTNGCDSIYMNGVYHQPDHSDWQNGTNMNGRGCEGCPAQNGNSCRFQSAPEQMNWDGDFRPAWEVQGKLPSDRWNQ